MVDRTAVTIRDAIAQDFPTDRGDGKLVRRCSYPLTGPAFVSRLCTDPAILYLGPDGATGIQTVDGLDAATLRECCGIPLTSAIDTHRSQP
ncbi:hypothetical protein ACFSGX_03685 [Sphingomonas arantia]|uniref:Uncharacterized protein n=1 Tax=Sphingomonas arantia TaxID=1460676 RepID=A0ABW4TVE6_9SPHN